jgi:hypothetical protein
MSPIWPGATLPDASQVVEISTPMEAQQAGLPYGTTLAEFTEFSYIVES